MRWLGRSVIELLNRDALDRICRVLHISEGEVRSIRPNPNAGMNNVTYILQTAAGEYLYRVPGQGTELFSCRAQECAAYRKLAGTGLTDELVDFDPETGAKLSVYYPGSRTCDPTSATDREAAMNLLRQFHNANVVLDGVDAPYDRLLRYARIAAGAGGSLAQSAAYRRVIRWLEAHEALFRCPADALCPVHADCLPGNLLFRADGAPILIDLEFASMGSLYGDLADFCHDADFSQSQCRILLQEYLCGDPDAENLRKLFSYCACVAAMWAAWADFKSCVERENRDFFAAYRDRSVRYAQDAIAWFAAVEAL